PTIYDVTYGFDATSATPTDPQQAIATDKVARTASRAFHVIPDPDGPVGGAIVYSSVTSNAPTFDIDFTQPNDGAGAGVANVQIQRESTPFDNGDNTC